MRSTPGSVPQARSRTRATTRLILNCERLDIDNGRGATIRDSRRRAAQKIGAESQPPALREGTTAKPAAKAIASVTTQAVNAGCIFHRLAQIGETKGFGDRGPVASATALTPLKDCSGT
jgi:hypothetical protein